MRYVVVCIRTLRWSDYCDCIMYVSLSVVHIVSLCLSLYHSGKLTCKLYSSVFCQPFFLKNRWWWWWCWWWQYFYGTVSVQSHWFSGALYECSYLLIYYETSILWRYHPRSCLHWRHWNLRSLLCSGNKRDRIKNLAQSAEWSHFAVDTFSEITKL